MRLNELFEVPKSYVITEPKIRYYSSLVPLNSILKRVSLINFIKSIDDKIIDLDKIIPNENSVNTSHLYKPVYTYTEDKDVINCYVTSDEVLAHTLKGLCVICSEVIGRVDLEVEFYGGDEDVNEYVKEWDIHSNVIICRLASMIQFMEMIYLIEREVEIDLIKKLLTKSELSRIDKDAKVEEDVLRDMLLKNHNYSRSEFEQNIQLQNQVGTYYIQSANVFYKGKDITLVQLPWGYTLSRNLLNSVFNVNPAINKLGVIGGVGYIAEKSKDLDIDDIFIPEALVDLRGEAVDVNNHLSKNSKGIYPEIFYKKKIEDGKIKTLVPEIKKFQYTDEVLDRNNGVSAYDMETAGFFEVLREYPDTKRGIAMYTMDKELDNIHLGDTYYYEKFLREFYSRFNRGKYVCFSLVLDFICEM